MIQVRLPLPFALDHVNAWLIRDGNAWTLVDTGVSDVATRDVWEGISSVLGGRPVRRVIATHYHPDHIGLAGWFCTSFGAELWCSQVEWLQARMWTLDPPQAAEAACEGFYRRAGVPADTLRELAPVARLYSTLVDPPPLAFHGLRDGEEITIDGGSWRVIIGRGHSPGHVCLYSPDRSILISGDQVLPSITPNVSVDHNEPDADPVADFMHSLSRLAQVNEHVLVLPSHGRAFVGLRGRVGELEAHHRQRLLEVHRACARPRTAFQIMSGMFPRMLDAHQATFAVGESVAHLNNLIHAGSLRRHRPEAGPDLYEKTAETLRGLS